MVNSSSREPSAASRTMANVLHDMFLALTLEEFTRKEALQIVGVTLSTVLSQEGNNGKD